jgi:hypothetical protein
MENLIEVIYVCLSSEMQ